MREMGGLGVSAVVGLGALFLLWRLIGRARAGLAQAQQAVREESESDLGGALVPRKGAEVQRVERKLRQVSQESPEAIARVVRAWLAE
jgi:flagellar biosynthesis/type III secretory pathway M-ring protein FliF/YscJ